MKKVILYFSLLAFLSCGNPDDGNPILPDIQVNESLFLNNPSNNDLLFTGGYVIIGGGIKGIVVYRGAGEQFFAFDLACPHLSPSECTKMDIEDGFFMVCTCDDTKFALALGGAPQSGTKYPAKEYKVSKSGSTLIISNF